MQLQKKWLICCSAPAFDSTVSKNDHSGSRLKVRQWILVSVDVNPWDQGGMTVFHRAQADGQSERQIQALEDCLRCITSQYGRD